jgi:hypothetical protein
MDIVRTDTLYDICLQVPKRCTNVPAVVRSMEEIVRQYLFQASDVTYILAMGFFWPFNLVSATRIGRTITAYETSVEAWRR